MGLAAAATRENDGQVVAIALAASLGLALLLVLWQQRKIDAEALAWRNLKVRYFE